MKLFIYLSSFIIFLASNLYGQTILEEFNPQAFELNTPCDDSFPELAGLTIESEYSDENAFLLLLYSFLGHQDEDSFINERLHRIGFDAPKLIGKDKDGFKAMAAKRGDLAILSFRGTEHPVDVIADTLFFQTKPFAEDSIQGKVYAGIYWRYKLLEKSMLETVKTWGNEGTRFIVTGHSLGGASALLMALKLKQLGYDVVSLYTYGQPRMGNEDFSQFAASELPHYYRIHEVSDITPQLPPTKPAAHAFSKIVPWFHPVLRNTVKSLARTIDYGVHPGIGFALGDEGIYKMDQSEESIEEEFWVSYTNSMKGKSLIGVIKELATSNVGHHPHKYICKLSNGLR